MSGKKTGKSEQPERVYYVMNAVMSLANAVMFTTYAMYYVKELGLNPLELVLVGTFLELTVLLLEVPTGVVADTYGRKRSVVAAFMIMGAAYVLEGSVSLLAHGWLNGIVSMFVLVAAAEMIRGAGEAFLSGAGQAWIADEAGEERIGRIFIRSGQLSQLAAVIGIVISVALASVQLYLPYLTGGMLYLALAVYLAVAMREPNFTPAVQDGARRGTWASMRGTFTEGIAAVRGKPMLIAALLVSLFLGASSEGFDRLWEALMISDIGLPSIGTLSAVAWFGIIGIIGMLLGIGTNEIVIRRMNLENAGTVKRWLLVLTALKIVCSTSFALSGSLKWALGSIWLLGVVNAVFHPLYDAWLNKNIESRARATVLSFMSQSNAIGQSAGGPLVGWIGVRWTVRASIAASALLLLPVLPLLRGRRNFTQK